LESALADPKSLSIIEVDLDPHDASPALDRLGRRLGKER
jgi:hypothetical protein